MSLQSLKLALGEIMNYALPQTWKIQRAIGDDKVVVEVKHFLALGEIARKALAVQNTEEEQLKRGLADQRRSMPIPQADDTDPWEGIEGIGSSESGRAYCEKSNISEVPRAARHSDWVMPFGKYKGMPLGKVETGYLEWCLKKEWLRPEAREHIEGALDERGPAESYAKRWKHEE